MAGEAAVRDRASSRCAPRVPVRAHAALLTVALAGLAAQPRGPVRERAADAARPGRAGDGLDVSTAQAVSRSRSRPWTAIAPARRLPEGGPGAGQRRLAGQAAGGRARLPRASSARPTCWPCAWAGGTTFGRPGFHALVRGRRVPGRQPASTWCAPTTPCCAGTRRPAAVHRPAVRHAQPRVPGAARPSAARVAARCLFFVRHLHAAVFVDAAHAWSGASAWPT